jgi:hypothetical protein
MVLTADQELDDSAATSGCRVEPSVLARLTWVGRYRLRGHTPEERKVVARTVPFLPARLRSIGWEQADQEVKVLSPVAQHHGPLEPWTANEDVPRCSGLGRNSKDGSDQQCRDDDGEYASHALISLSRRFHHR